MRDIYIYIDTHIHRHTISAFQCKRKTTDETQALVQNWKQISSVVSPSRVDGAYKGFV